MSEFNDHLYPDEPTLIETSLMVEAYRDLPERLRQSFTAEEFKAFPWWMRERWERFSLEHRKAINWALRDQSKGCV